MSCLLKQERISVDTLLSRPYFADTLTFGNLKGKNSDPGTGIANLQRHSP